MKNLSKNGEGRENEAFVKYMLQKRRLSRVKKFSKKGCQMSSKNIKIEPSGGHDSFDFVNVWKRLILDKFSSVIIQSKISKINGFGGGGSSRHYFGEGRAWEALCRGGKRGGVHVDPFFFSSDSPNLQPARGRLSPSWTLAQTSRQKLGHSLIDCCFYPLFDWFVMVFWRPPDSQKLQNFIWKRAKIHPKIYPKIKRKLSWGITRKPWKCYK